MIIPQEKEDIPKYDIRLYTMTDQDIINGVYSPIRELFDTMISFAIMRKDSKPKYTLKGDIKLIDSKIKY